MPLLEVQPPARRYKMPDAKPTLFLAGSIEMGKAEQWQRKVIAGVDSAYSLVFNPRRDDWDSSWTQDIDSPEFNAQVNWELDMIEIADVVAFYFDPATVAPITLLELGKVLESKAEVHVCCPVGYHRKGNVEIACERKGVKIIRTLDGLITMLKMARKSDRVLPGTQTESPERGWRTKPLRALR